jgi:DNA invertase Pin-like site-specific DNA recombinase
VTAFDYMREGDQFICTKLDRLARSVSDLLAIVARLEAKKVGLRILSMSGAQSLDTSTATATSRLMLAACSWRSVRLMFNSGNRCRRISSACEKVECCRTIASVGGTP